MKEPTKTNLLLPLGIGAGVLLLLAGVNKKASAATSTTALPPSNTTGDDAKAPTEETVAPGQINPNPAPSYTPPVQRIAETSDEGADERQIDDTADEQSAVSQDDGQDFIEEEAGGYDSGSEIDSTGYTRQHSSMPPVVRNQPKPVMRTQQPFLPGGKPSMRTSGAMVKQSTAYRPGAYNPKQARFDNRMSQPVNYRPGAMHQPLTPPQAPMPALVKTNAVKAAPNGNGKIFPLRMGMTNSYVKEVQRRIGVPATGYFGTMTLTALRSRYNVTEVSETLYKQIITGKAVVVRKPVVKQAPQRKTIPKGKPTRKTATGKPLNRYKPKSS